MDFEKEILEVKTYGKVPKDGQQIHIALAIDEPFIPPAGILMTSILKNNPAHNFLFDIFLDKISPADIERINELCQISAKIQVKLYHVAPNLFNDMYFEKNYSPAIFYRILAADILSEQLTEMIYMDSDMLCLKSMDEFFQNPPDKKFLKVIPDSGSWLPRHKKNLSIPDEYRYFNAGIMHLNLKQWREEKISDQLMELLKVGKYSFPDQDTLNIIAYRNGYEIEYLPDKFNHFFRVEGVEVPITDEVVIEHFAGHLKPWHPWFESDAKKFYEYYQSISPWRDFKYLPRDYQECRLMGRALRREGNWTAALQWYSKYVTKKFERFF